MTGTINFEVPGLPVAWQRGRIDARGGKPVVFQSSRVGQFKAQVVHAFKAESSGEVGKPHDWTGPVKLWIVARFPIPDSRRRKRSRGVMDGDPFTSAPDADNLAKIVGDALNGIAYRDDRQIAEMTVRKIYSDGPPGMLVSISYCEVESFWRRALRAISPAAPQRFNDPGDAPPEFNDPGD